MRCGWDEEYVLKRGEIKLSLTKGDASVLALELRASWHLRIRTWRFPKSKSRARQSSTTTFANMLFPSFAILAAASSLLSFATAHNIQMKAHQRECFHEQLHKGDKMTVTFQVGDREFGGSGNLEIDFWVREGDTRLWARSIAVAGLTQLGRLKLPLAATKSTSAA